MMQGTQRNSLFFISPVGSLCHTHGVVWCLLFVVRRVLALQVLSKTMQRRAMNLDADISQLHLVDES